VVKADPGDIWAAKCLEETERHLKNPELPSVFIIDVK
jgi:hypothetical protein